jgi:hypothetical protein
MATDLRPMLAGSFVLMVILLEASIVIHDGHAAPLILQLKLGTTLQPMESVKRIGVVVVKVELTG